MCHNMLIVVLVCVTVTVATLSLEQIHAQSFAANPEYVSFTLKNNTAFPARDAHSAEIVGNTLIIAGGEDANRVALNDVWTSTPPDSGVFVQVNVTSTFTHRADHSTVVHGNKLIILAGQFNKTVLYNDVWATTDLGVTWTRTTAAAPWAPRIGAMTVLYKNVLIMVGGYLATTTPPIHCSEVWNSTDDGATWNLVSNNTFPGRADARVDVVGNALVMTGGEDTPLKTFAQVWRSTDGGATWSVVNPSAPFGQRFQHTSAVVGDQLVLTTGLLINFSVAANDVWASPDQGSTWTQITAQAGYTPRAHAEATVYQSPSGPIFILTGGNKGGGSQVWMARGAPLLPLINDSTVPPTSTPLPSSSSSTGSATGRNTASGACVSIITLLFTILSAVAIAVAFL